MPSAVPSAVPTAATALLRLAGVPSIRLGEAMLNTGTRKALALALLLALEPGQRRARVAELLWPELEPMQARRNLRRDLFRLRQQGLPVHDGAGDSLHLSGLEMQWPSPGAQAPVWLDGIDEVAGAELGHWVQAQRERLQREWVARLTQQARDLEAAGQPQAAWRAYSELLADGVAGAGHAEARAALRRLPSGLSAGAAAAEGSTPAPRTPAPPTLPFVGREAEQQQIGDALRAQRRVILEGSPGVGKTRLALQALAGFGGVLLLRCRPEDAAVPYAGAMRALRVLQEAAPDVALPAAVRRELASLVPTWGSGAAEPDAADPARLHRAYHRAFELLAAGNFGAVVVDDWQWADEPSLALWQGDATAGRPALQPLALPSVWVHRSGELPRAALERRHQWLDSGQAVRVPVKPLQTGDALALLRGLAAQAAPAAQRESAGAALGDDTLHAVLERSGGNPLFLIETLRHALHGGSPSLPGSVQEMVVARARALGPAVRAVLELASLEGDETEPPLLAAAAGLSELAVARALEHAHAAELLSADARGRLTFSHDLVAQALADSLSPVRRHALHAQLAGALAAAGAEPGRVARHFELAGRAAEAAPWHLQAAQRALQRHALAEAVAACDAAVAGAPAAAGGAELRLRARLLRARAQARQADVAGAEATLHAAMADAHQAGPAALIDWVLDRVELFTQTSRAEAALAEMAALEHDPALSAAQRRKLLLERSAALSLLGRHAESQPLFRHLLAELPPSALAERKRVLALFGRDAYWSGDLALGMEVVQQGLALARDLHDEHGIGSGLLRLGILERDLGHVPQALEHLTEAADSARRDGHLELLRSALAVLARVMLDQMRLAEAEALIVEAEQAAPGWDNPTLENVFDERRLQLHWRRGEVAAAWSVCERGIERQADMNNLHSHLGSLMMAVELALVTGDTPRARHHLRSAEALSRQAGADSMHGLELPTFRAQLALAQGHAAAALAQAREWLARRPTERVEPRARMLITGALAALARGQRDQAGTWLAEAAALRDLSLPQQALLLAARVRHARADPEALAVLLPHAQAWLAQGAVPPLEAAWLRAELAPGAPPAGRQGAPC